eukprot:12913106-Prorocentrum_lima.AAC.1
MSSQDDQPDPVAGATMPLVSQRGESQYQQTFPSTTEQIMKMNGSSEEYGSYTIAEYQEGRPTTQTG